MYAVQTGFFDSGPEATGPAKASAIVIYDGECPACTGFSKIVALLDRHHRTRLVPAQDPRALEFVPGETPEDLRKTFHFVTPEGKVLVLGEALLGILSMLPGLALVGRVIEGLPNHRVIANRLYAWLARNRPWISLLLRA
jgi:predicted DCC family thiol-disulfide oxidoreductase YuxK